MLRTRTNGLSDWSYSLVSSNSARVRPLGMALAMYGRLASHRRVGQCIGRDVTARATHFVPICWILAEGLPTADSALLIKTDNLLVWWFQGRLDQLEPSRRFRMTSIAQKGVGNRMEDGQETVKAARKHMLTQAPGTWGVVRIRA